MLYSVIIVLREILEASLLISLLLAACAHLHLSRRWLWPALPLGGSGAFLFAHFNYQISLWFDGMGQEVVNVTLLALVVLNLTGILFLLLRYCLVQREILNRLWAANCALAMISSLSREGSEIFIYITGFVSAGTNASPIITGAAIGTAIGASIGAVLYYVLLLIPRRYFYWLGPVLLTFVCAGQAVEAARELAQSGWLNSGPALWDSSALIAETSLSGQLLYAAFGYEATPSQLQVIFFAATVSLPLIFCLHFFCLSKTGKRHG